MSSKTKKIENNILNMPKVNYVYIFFRVDLQFDKAFETDIKTCYYIMSDVPENEYNKNKEGIYETARMQFLQAVKQGGFFELYNLGKNAKDEKPVLYNFNQVKTIEIKDFYEVDENFKKYE